MLVEFFRRDRVNAVSEPWFQTSRAIETAEKRNIKGSFSAWGNFAGGVSQVRVQALLAGHWFDLVGSILTADGTVEVDIFADAVRGRVSLEDPLTDINAVFETAEVLVRGQRIEAMHVAAAEAS